eukprot:2939069-Pyramimonas_sp.AAC.1
MFTVVVARLVSVVGGVLLERLPAGLGEMHVWRHHIGPAHVVMTAEGHLPHQHTVLAHAGASAHLDQHQYYYYIIIIITRPKRGNAKDLGMCCTKRERMGGGGLFTSLVLTEKHQHVADSASSDVVLTLTWQEAVGPTT